MKFTVIGRLFADHEEIVRMLLRDATSAVVLAQADSPLYQKPRLVVLVCRHTDLLTAQQGRGATSFEVGFEIYNRHDVKVPAPRRTVFYREPETSPMDASTNETITVYCGIPF